MPNRSAMKTKCPSLHHDEPRTDQRRLLQPYGSSVDIAAVVPRRLGLPVASQEPQTELESRKSEDRATLGIFGTPGCLISDESLNEIMAVYKGNKYRPEKVYKILWLHHSNFDRRSLPLWLKFCHEHPNFQFVGQRLNFLMKNRQLEDVAKLLLPYLNHAEIGREATKMFRLVAELLSSDSNSLLKKMSKLKITPQEALVLFDLDKTHAISRRPKSAITWLRYTELLRNEKVDLLYRKKLKNPNFMSAADTATLLLKDKTLGEVEFLIKQAEDVPELKTLVASLQAHVPNEEVV